MVLLRPESKPLNSLCIYGAQIFLADGSLAYRDVTLFNGAVHSVETAGSHHPNTVDRIDAGGALLVPGIHDHHTHFYSLAASLTSVNCGSPAVTSAGELEQVLKEHAKKVVGSNAWIRGFGYDDSMSPKLTRQWLDRNGPACPIRIQHRSGRLWILNSRAIHELKEHLSSKSLSRDLSIPNDGRLYDCDKVFRGLSVLTQDDLAQASMLLSKWGVTSINDMTPSNNIAALECFRELTSKGIIRQKVRVSGDSSLQRFSANSSVEIGERKFHLAEAELPSFENFVAEISAAHDQGRNVAVHCVTEVELVFTLAAIREAGVFDGDRLEHASVVPRTLLEQIAELKLQVVTQPNFITERGDGYLQSIDSHDWENLYRVRSLLDVGVNVAFGTDFPFGNANPWFAMASAVSRETAGGSVIGRQESLSPEQSLKCFLGPLGEVGTARKLECGMEADLCLLQQDWQSIRSDLVTATPRHTWVSGRLIL